MKEFFPGHFTKGDAEHNALWAKCVFVFDANILLNMYRYSDDTRKSFFQVLEKLSDRIWIPYRVAEEYLSNRLGVIYEQQEGYSTAIAELQNIRKKLESTRQHPFVSEKVMKKAEPILDELAAELESNKAVHNQRMTNDEIKFHIAELFKGKVGGKLEDDELEKIILEGERRYAEKIPPGYSDAKKAGAEEYLSARCRPYGDLIVWKQIIQKSSQSKSPVIFVTDDGKEDWWLRFKGQTIGPRPELIEEFMSSTGLEFHMYHPERFLSLAGDYLKQENPISVAMLDEVRNLRVKEQIEREIAEPEVSAAAFTNRYENVAAKRDALMRELSVFVARLDSIKGQIKYFERERRELLDEILLLGKEQGAGNIEDNSEFAALKAKHSDQVRQLNFLNEEYRALLSHVEELRNEINHASEDLKKIQRRHYSLNEITADDL